jgi:hypothetical protein
MAYLDFDTILIDNQCFEETDLVDTFSFFSKLGVKHFIFTYEMDFDRVTISRSVQKAKQLNRRIQSLLPRGCRAYTVVRPLLIQGLAFHPELWRLCLSGTNFLFLSLPLFVGDNWVPSDLNFLLYKQKINPVFTSFERNLFTNSKDLLGRISHISTAVYAMDAMFLTSADGFSVAQGMLQGQVRLLPCLSKHLSEYAGIQKSYERLLNGTSRDAYLTLCKGFNYTKYFLFH